MVERPRFRLADRGATSGSGQEATSRTSGSGTISPSGWRQLLPPLRWTSFILVVAAGVIWGWWSYRLEVRDSLRRVSEGAEVISQYAERLIQTQTVVQTSLLERARAEGPEFLRSAEFQRFLAQVETSQSFTYGLMVVDRQGEVVAASRRHLVASPLAARFSEVTVDGGGFMVDRVFLYPNNVDAMILASPFNTQGFEGTIVSAFAAESVSDFLHAVASREGEFAMLLRPDGKILSRDTLSGSTRLPGEAPAMQAIGAADSGAFEAVAVFDGVERIHAFERTEGVPIFSIFGTPTGAVTAAWLARAVPVWLLLAIIGSLSWLACTQAQRRLEAGMAERDRQTRLEEAEKRAAQRTHLVREMNHRIKNNLSLISSLIGIQMKAPGGLDGGELRGRIHAIQEVHDMMYHAEDAAMVDLGEMLAHIAASPALVPREICARVEVDVEPGILVGPEVATPVALVAAELITNAVKHAFADRTSGTIAVTLHKWPEGEARLVVQDDGVGMPEDVVRSSGTRIIRGLVDQVGGRLDVSSEAGLRIEIVFPVDGKQDV